MVDIVTSANRYLYRNVLEDMYALRYDVAVNELGWTLPGSTGARDKDKYDFDDTVYFLKFDDGGKLIATARLNPTTRPHLMTDIFPSLCHFGGVPQADDIYEYSRFLVRKQGVTRRANLEAQAHISLAIVEYCLAANIRQVSWVSYKRSYPLALRMWKTKPLGLPQYFEADQTEYIAALSDMSTESLRRTRDLARIHYPVCNMTVPIEIAPQLTRLTSPPLTLLG